jgi:hypothetical protein
MALRDFLRFDNGRTQTQAIAHVRQANLQMAYSF